MSTVPEWITSQRLARGECITCGQPMPDHQIQCDECWLKIHGTK